MSHQATHNQLGDVRQMMNKGLFQLRMIAPAIAGQVECWIALDSDGRSITPETNASGCLRHAPNDTRSPGMVTHFKKADDAMNAMRAALA
jgi:hypothetical protein